MAFEDTNNDDQDVKKRPATDDNETVVGNDAKRAKMGDEDADSEAVDPTESQEPKKRWRGMMFIPLLVFSLFDTCQRAHHAPSRAHLTNRHSSSISRRLCQCRS